MKLVEVNIVFEDGDVYVDKKLKMLSQEIKEIGNLQLIEIEESKKNLNLNLNLKTVTDDCDG